MKAILVDIDNTLLSQNRRKQKILMDVFGEWISIQDISRDFSLMTVIENIAKAKNLDYGRAKADFESKFFSDLYYDDADLFDVIGNSNMVLKEVCKDNSCEIFYLTSRSRNVTKQTLSQLTSKGYPYADNAHIIFAPVINEDLHNYCENSYDSKKLSIGELLDQYQIIVHIGDLASDAAASYVHGISSIVLSNHENEVVSSVAQILNISADDIDPYGILCIANWNDIGEYILNRIGKSSSINDACKIHADNYASWMSDLDQKSSLILVVSTFSASIFLSFLTNAETTLRILLLSIIGFVLSLVSMAFAIRSFSSRITHGNESITKVLWSVFTNNYKSKTFSPINDRKKSANSKFPENLGAKYLYRRYSTFNEDCFVGKNMINLRAANYEKIYPEFLAKVCLGGSILVLFIIGVFNVSPSATIIQTENIGEISLTIMTDQQIEIPQIHCFTSSDFDFEAFTLSKSGETKLNAIIAAYEDQSFDELYLCIPPENHNELSDFIQKKRDDIQLSIIYEKLVNSGIEIKVVLLKNVAKE